MPKSHTTPRRRQRRAAPTTVTPRVRKQAEHFVARLELLRKVSPQAARLLEQLLHHFADGVERQRRRRA